MSELKLSFHQTLVLHADNTAAIIEHEINLGMKIRESNATWHHVARHTVTNGKVKIISISLKNGFEDVLQTFLENFYSTNFDLNSLSIQFLLIHEGTVY